MGIKSYNPYTPSRRHMTGSDFSEITAAKPEKSLVTSLKKNAGRKRHMGIRPTVRGSVMNPNDHPHGGGEGKTGIGRPGPCTPWGKPALGLKTRKKNKQSNKHIVRRRDGKALSK